MPVALLACNSVYLTNNETPGKYISSTIMLLQYLVVSLADRRCIDSSTEVQPIGLYKKCSDKPEDSECYGCWIQPSVTIYFLKKCQELSISWWLSFIFSVEKTVLHGDILNFPLDSSFSGEKYHPSVITEWSLLVGCDQDTIWLH